MKLGIRRMTLVATALTAGFLMTGCNVDQEGSKSESSSYEITDKVTTLDVRTPGGDIKVVAGDQDTIRVTEKLTYSGDKPKTQHTASGGTLKLGAGEGCGKEGEASKCKVDYTLEVPRALAAVLDSRGGNVQVTGLAGSLEVKAGGGKVTADNLASKRLTVEANGGAITAAFVSAPDTVNINTRSGDVSVQVPSAEAYAVKATTNSGSEKVSVKTDPASTRKITLHTDGGSVQLTSA